MTQTNTTQMNKNTMEKGKVKMIKQTQFTDRYQATGTPYPDKNSCEECEGMGIYPVKKDTLNAEALKSPNGRLLIIGQKDTEEDDWVFVQCPYCNGTRIKKD